MPTAKTAFPTGRLPETLTGAALGAAAGYGLDRLRDPKNRSGWRAALLGGAAGAVGGNVLGGLGRRYVSNKVLPLSYSNPLGQLMPRGVGDVWRAAVLDQPSYDPDLLAKGRQADPGLFDDVLGARRELFRRQLGAHTPDPAADYFAPNPDGTSSLNPNRPGMAELAHKLLVGGPKADTSTVLEQARLADAGEAPAGLLGKVLGGISDVDLKDNVLSVKDRWDVTPSPAEKGFLRTGLGKALTLDRSWLSAPYDGAAGKVDYANPGTPNGQVLQSTLARWLFDRLSVEDPTITQQIRLTPGGAATPLTGAGRPYGGGR